MNTYRCPHCNDPLTRESGKAWIRSYCSKTGRMVRLQLVKL
jgi:phage FluMu protein Com